MDDDAPEFNALILAGGRSSRLGGEPKQHLVFRGSTLLQRALDAAAGARHIVVVGPDPKHLPEGVLSCREEPEFSGPAAGIAAGLRMLHGGRLHPEYTLVLACDMPLVADAVEVLKTALAEQAGKPDAVMARSGDEASGGRPQPLSAFYRTAALQKAADGLAARGALVNASVRALLASLDVRLVTVPAEATADVDSWDDAAALGIAPGRRDRFHGR